MKFIFILGRDIELSIAECKAYFDDFEILERFENVFLVECNLVDFSRLGGVVKVAKVLTQAIGLNELEYALNKDVIYSGSKNKLVYSVENYKSDYGEFVKEYLKEWFKKNHFKAQYKKELSPSKGAKHFDILVEFILFKEYLGKTIFVSDPSKLEFRDKNTIFSGEVGTSLRLARILINLSGVKKGVLFDPSCGDGSILQEGMLMGYDVIGYDKKIINAKKNISWLKSHYNLITNCKLLYDLNLKKNSVDLIVTEPDLGPPLRKLASLEDAKKISFDLKKRYLELLDLAIHTLRPNGFMVIIVSKIRVYPNKEVGFNFEKMVENKHFKLVIPQLEYFTPRSKIRRWIYVIQKI